MIVADVYKHFIKSISKKNINKEIIITKLVLYLIINILFSIIYLFLSDDNFGGIGIHQHQNILLRWSERFYYSFITGLTIGFGDIYPKTLKAKFLTILQMIVLLSIFII